jgi:selenoprotein W-related protein
VSTEVEIEYCVPCGHLNRAIDTQRLILERFGRRIDGVRLKTGHGGVFTIRVDGKQIYHKNQGSTSTASSETSKNASDPTRIRPVQSTP